MFLFILVWHTYDCIKFKPIKNPWMSIDNTYMKVLYCYFIWVPLFCAWVLEEGLPRGARMLRERPWRRSNSYLFFDEMTSHSSCAKLYIGYGCVLKGFGSQRLPLIIIVMEELWIGKFSSRTKKPNMLWPRIKQGSHFLGWMANIYIICIQWVVPVGLNRVNHLAQSIVQTGCGFSI